MVIVVKKKLSNETVKDVYDVLQKHRARIKRRSILMASFVLGVNIFAWFVFISKADVKVNANIISWDVNFSDSSEVISKIVVETTDLYPGMPTYEKEIYITNYSDLKGTFDFDIKSIRVMDREIVDENMTHENALSYLNSTFPFIVSFSSSKTDLEKKDNMVFTIYIDWPLEANDVGARDFYRLTDHYIFDPAVTYYTYSNGYLPVGDVTDEVFTANKTGYYVEKDDADTFWGATCEKFRDETSSPCFSFNLLLKVSQKDDDNTN